MSSGSNSSLCDAVNESNQTFPKQERNAFCCIACLAFADLLIGVLFCPLELYNNIPDCGISSIHVCRFYVAINIFAEAASINTLILISFDRYLKISKPLRYKSVMTTHKSLVMISIIWLISAANVIFAMFSYNGSRGIYVSNCGCFNENPVLFTFYAVFAFFLPTVVIIIIYIRVLVIAHRRRNRSRIEQLAGTNQVESQSATFYKDLKNVRMTAIVVGAFIFCWGPFFISQVFRIYHPQAVKFILQSVVARDLFRAILPIMNSVCNPFIYACYDIKYREAFKCMLKRIMKR